MITSADLLEIPQIDNLETCFLNSLFMLSVLVLMVVNWPFLSGETFGPSVTGVECAGSVCSVRATVGCWCPS